MAASTVFKYSRALDGSRIRSSQVQGWSATSLVSYKLTFFFGALRLSTPQEHKHSLRGAIGKVGVAGPAGA